jgi:hypothetical protein
MDSLSGCKNLENGGGFGRRDEEKQYCCKCREAFFILE